MRNGEDFSEQDLELAQKAIGYRFRDKELLKTCFTHKTYSNAFGGENNERLEFLGDAVLELCVTEALYRGLSSDEGELTGIRQQLVSQSALEAACDRAALRKFLRYSGGENNVAGKTPSSLFEAVIAGVYLDGGLKEAKKFIDAFLVNSGEKNYKSLLQELVQETMKRPPDYVTEERDGKYYSVVKALGREAQGEGTGKKAAEIAAAKALYQSLTENQG